MRVSLHVENLLLASWETDREAVERVIPQGAQPATVGGSHLISLVCFRVRSGRIGRLPIVRFSQANLRTYVTWKGEPAVLFLAARVSAPGLPGLALGAPYKSVRLRVRKGEVLAPGLGLSVRYRVAGTADPGELGRHELGIFESGGTKAIRIERGPSEWHAAELVGPARADLLLAFGFAPRGDPTLLYAPTASFVTKRPAPLG